MIDPNDPTSALKGLLLLHKAENMTRNVLAVLGLVSLDFGKVGHLLWDAEEITVQAQAIDPACTCLSEPKDPTVYRVKDTLHSNRCHLAMWDRLIRHPWLVEVDADDDQTTLYTFQWPRDITPYRATIQAAFPELNDETFWANFQRSWGGLVAQMPEARPSLAERTIDAEDVKGEVQDAAAGVEAEPALEPQEVSGEGMDFGDLDFDALPAAQTEVVQVIAMPVDPELKVQIHEPEGEEVERPALVVRAQADETSRIEVVHGAGNPAMEAAAQKVLDGQAEAKRGRGRPKGTGKIQKAQALEADAGAVVPPADGQPIPACQRFTALFAEEMSRLCEVGQRIAVADTFPIDQIRDLKNSLDRLALRAAHLEFRGAHDMDDPTAINPLIEVSLANVTAQVNAAVRDLGLAPEKPKSWEDFAKNVKEAVDLSKSVLEVTSQMGAGPAIQEPAKPAAA